MPDLKGKVAFITGASSGIGAGAAVHFASLGCKIAINGRDLANLANVVEQCVRSGLNRDDILTLPGDITNKDNRINMIEKLVAHFGKLDILINNAGTGWLSPILKTSETEFDFVLNINLQTVLSLCKLAAPHLIASQGNIINISSVLSYRISGFAPAYSISKAAQDHLTRGLALELGPLGVRVNSINPGYVRTDIARGLSEEEAEAFWNQVMNVNILNRLGEIEEIVKPMAFLASGDASFITGACILVDGGHCLKT